mmetsp:Transcript_19899/g.33422  ORF Transcript_19899/g.33422 Transcript_19899/m.33422 type:complete len:272 (-) Transcript_19899:1116-1931(-)
MDPHPAPIDEDLGGTRDDARRDLLQVLRVPLLQELQDGRGGGAHGNVGHKREVLHQPASLALGGLRGANHAPMAVVKLARLGEFALAADGRVEAPQMRQRGRVREPIQHLRDPRPHPLLALLAPVARRQRVLQPLADRLRLDGIREINLLPAVNTLLHVNAHVFGHLAEQHAEQAAQQGPRKIQTLVSVMITIILLSTPEGANQQPMDDVSKKVRLLRLAVVSDPNVGQKFFLQDLFRVADTLLPGNTNSRTALPDVIQRHLLILDHESLL